jgi:SAM-dependent methyltransferase
VTASRDATLRGIARYYAAKLDEHGATARGVDWNSEESQLLRFEQLVRAIDEPGDFTVVDWGSGYGALYEYLAPRWPRVRYTGWDIAPAMVEAGRARWSGEGRVRFELGAEPLEPADYAFASGIFNVRLEANDGEWLEFIESGLDVLDRAGRKAFAFNCLTSYSDRDRMRDYLYYADPRSLFDRCVTRYSRHVTLLHGYGLYEFTIVVRKAP